MGEYNKNMAEPKKYIEYTIKFPSTKERLKRHEEKIESFRKKIDGKRTFTDKLADGINTSFGSVSFFFGNLIFFAVWIGLNVNIIPGVIPFDPFPFGFLTMIVSLEAIFLSIFVLMSQNRQAKIGDLREEVDLQINRIAEKEITKLLQMQAILMKHQGIRIEGDEQLEGMMKAIDTNMIQRELEKEVKKEDQKNAILPIISNSNGENIGNVMKKISNFFENVGGTGV